MQPRIVNAGNDDDRHVADQTEVQRIAGAIETRHVDLGKTSGFERLYPLVTRLYFGGVANHLADPRTIPRPAVHLACIVGDPVSYLRVMIRTGQILAEIASSLGYEAIGLDLFHTRLATATREQPREEVVMPRWPGPRTEAGGHPSSPTNSRVMAGCSSCRTTKPGPWGRTAD